jgi:hypothetical protein
VQVSWFRETRINTATTPKKLIVLGSRKRAEGWCFPPSLIQISRVANRSTHLSTWIDEELKRKFSAVAASRGLSESAFLKQLVEHALVGVNPELALTAGQGVEARGARITVRLLPADRLLLRERAAARGMRAASYVSTLIRAHLRSLSPLPDREIEALQGIAMQLAAMGRNVRTIALTAPSTGFTPEHTRTMLKLCIGVRDYVRSILSANIRSWEGGNGESTNPGS